MFQEKKNEFKDDIIGMDLINEKDNIVKGEVLLYNLKR